MSAYDTAWTFVRRRDIPDSLRPFPVPYAWSCWVDEGNATAVVTALEVGDVVHVLTLHEDGDASGIPWHKGPYYYETLKVEAVCGDTLRCSSLRHSDLYFDLDSKVLAEVLINIATPVDPRAFVKLRGRPDL